MTGTTGVEMGRGSESRSIKDSLSSLMLGSSKAKSLAFESIFVSSFELRLAKRLTAGATNGVAAKEAIAIVIKVMSITLFALTSDTNMTVKKGYKK